MGRPHVCPYCGANKSVSKGVRKTKTMGDRCIRLCKACDRKFTPRNQKPVGPTEDKMAETCVQSNEAAGPVAVTEPDKPDEAMGEPEVPLEPDENSGMVSSREEEWTS